MQIVFKIMIQEVWRFKIHVVVKLIHIFWVWLIMTRNRTLAIRDAPDFTA